MHWPRPSPSSADSAYRVAPTIPAGVQFAEVERQHPYSIWARRALLMSAFCFYMGNRYDEAIQTADNFIQLHPGNRDIPYAYYLKAVALYEQIVDVYRDQSRTQAALTALQDLVRATRA